MNLKNPSMSGAVALLGVGLITLSGAVLVAGMGEAAHAGLAHDATGSGPVAADRSGSVVGRPSITMGQGNGDGCVAAEPLEWFGAIRELPGCVVVVDSMGNPELEGRFFPVDGGRLVDVNGDGHREAFLKKNASAAAFPVPLFREGVPEPNECVLTLQIPGQIGGELAFTERCVLESSTLAAFLLSQPWAAGATYAYGEAMGWRDLDGDADLDLVFRVQYWTPKSGGGHRGYWLENTGFEARQLLTGDLDGDGAVGASDLTMLLGGWTGN